MSWALQRVVPREPHKSKAVPLSKSLKSSRTQVWLISKFKQSSLVPHCTNDKTTQKTAQTLDEAPCRPSPSPHRRNRPTSGPQSCAMVGQAQLKSTSELVTVGEPTLRWQGTPKKTSATRATIAFVWRHVWSWAISKMKLRFQITIYLHKNTRNACKLLEG